MLSAVCSAYLHLSDATYIVMNRVTMVVVVVVVVGSFVTQAAGGRVLVG